MFNRILTAAIAASVLSVSASTAMASTYPIVFVRKNHVMRGENFRSGNDGVFKVSDGRVSCSGRYSWDNDASSISVPFRCTDGTKGMTTASRDFVPDGEVDYSTGSGRFSMSDGDKGVFYWGDAASQWR